MRFPRFKVQFSLRFMIAAIAVSAVIFYWMALPSINARRFISAMDSGDFATAERMYLHGEHGDPRTFGEIEEAMGVSAPEFAKDLVLLPTNVGTRQQLVDATKVVEPFSWHDLWNGERRVVVRWRRSNNSNGGGSFRVTATREAIKPGIIEFQDFGGMSISVWPSPHVPSR